MEAVVPTCEDLYEGDGFEQVHRDSDPSWRHGTRETQVFKRESDGTFWKVKFRLSHDGETNELEEGLATIRQVFAKQKIIPEHTITVYEA